MNSYTARYFRSLLNRVQIIELSGPHLKHFERIHKIDVDYLGFFCYSVELLYYILYIRYVHDRIELCALTISRE